jgi:hypothetical protein
MRWWHARPGLVLLGLAVVLAACANRAYLRQEEYPSLASAQGAVAYRLRAPSTDALPASVLATPQIWVMTGRAPEAPGQTGRTPNAAAVQIVYRYRPGARGSAAASTEPVVILESQNSGDQVRAIGIPTGSRHTTIDGRPVIVSQRPDTTETQIIWAEDGTAIDLDTTLPWGEAAQIFRSMADDAYSGGPLLPASGTPGAAPGGSQGRDGMGRPGVGGA